MVVEVVDKLGHVGVPVNTGDGGVVLLFMGRLVCVWGRENLSVHLDGFICTFHFMNSFRPISPMGRDCFGMHLSLNACFFSR